VTMDGPSDNYIGRAVEQFRRDSHRHRNDNGEHAVLFLQSRELIEPFIRRFYPVLRHYHPESVGNCLALSYDDPELGLRSQMHGFGSDMRAGNHPHDYASELGSYRDDGSYLACQAYDYFAAVLR
jgi:hypothetical protein